MVIYEVNLSIAPEVLERYEIWLKEHIEEMLQFPGFLDARIHSVLTDASSEDSEIGKAWAQRCIHYSVDTIENLEHYFEKHAPAMREDGLKRFGYQFKASRRILEAVIIPEHSI